MMDDNKSEDVRDDGLLLLFQTNPKTVILRRWQWDLPQSAKLCKLSITVPFVNTFNGHGDSTWSS